jgi:hypothetical protein
MDSMRTPPKIHRFYGEAMDFWWTMISFGEITLLQVDEVIYLQTHILFFLILAESLKSVIHNENIINILTTYNIGGYNTDNKMK